jgi:hypothetical protein
MSITTEQSDTAIRETFYNMEEGIEYVLNDFWFAETNRLRSEHDYSVLKDKQEWKFSRKGDQLFVKNDLAFDFTGKSNIAFALPFTLAFALAFSFSLVLQCNGLEKLNKDTCDGKVVEIDGKKYKLTAV